MPLATGRHSHDESRVPRPRVQALSASFHQPRAAADARVREKRFRHVLVLGPHVLAYAQLDAGPNVVSGRQGVGARGNGRWIHVRPRVAQRVCRGCVVCCMPSCWHCDALHRAAEREGVGMRLGHGASGSHVHFGLGVPKRRGGCLQSHVVSGRGNTVEHTCEPSLVNSTRTHMEGEFD